MAVIYELSRRTNTQEREKWKAANESKHVLSSCFKLHHHPTFHHHQQASTLQVLYCT